MVSRACGSMRFLASRMATARAGLKDYAAPSFGCSGVCGAERLCCSANRVLLSAGERNFVLSYHHNRMGYGVKPHDSEQPLPHGPCEHAPSGKLDGGGANRNGRLYRSANQERKCKREDMCGEQRMWERLLFG